MAGREYAVRRADRPLLRLFSGWATPAEQATELRMAARHGRRQSVARLLELGADPVSRPSQLQSLWRIPAAAAS